jgi:hypothetical protein
MISGPSTPPVVSPKRTNESPAITFEQPDHLVNLHPTTLKAALNSAATAIGDDCPAGRDCKEFQIPNS